MRILLATGIFPPDIGGPALYSEQLSKEFSKNGIEVIVITYGKNFKPAVGYKVVGISRRWPILLRQLIYLFKVCWYSRGVNGILAFDELGAGLPAVLAGKILNKKVIIRLGGDFLWEKFIEEEKGWTTISNFYAKHFYAAFPILRKLSLFTLQNFHRVVFNTNFQRNLFIQYCGLKKEKTSVVGNVFIKELNLKKETNFEKTKTILWAGRFIKLKNLPFLLNVFKKLLEKDASLVLKLIGEGPEKESIINLVKSQKLENKVMIQEALNKSFLNEEIKKAYFCILPSLSDINPNFVLQGLLCDCPVVLTKETGLKEQFPELLYADPLDEDSFVRAGLNLLDRNFYADYQKKISAIQYKYSWSDLAGDFLNILNT